MIPSAHTRAWLSRSARQYAYAFWMAALITVVTIKMWWMSDAAAITALGGPFGSLVTAGAILIAACIGIERLAPPQPLQAGESPLVSERIKRPPAAAATASAPRPRPKLTIPLLSSAELVIAGVVLALIVGAAGALYAKGHADGYAGGYGAARATYEKLMADQAKANQAAVDAANKQLVETADQLDKSNAALDAALAQLEAGSGGTDATALGLDAARMKALGGIK